jgi:predicted CoA-binding protein
MSETVVVFGASPDPDRYSNRAVRDLVAHGHRVVPVHPVAREIEGIEVTRSLQDVKVPVDTVSVYVSPGLVVKSAAALAGLRPRRIILNPGTDTDEAVAALEHEGVQAVRACTLVMLRTGTF